MSSPWVQHPIHIPTDNFKIQPGLFIQDPYGIFLEDIMFWINQERVRLGMKEFQFFLYDRWDPEALPDTEGYLRDGFEPEVTVIEGPPISFINGDTQRKPFTPGGPPSQFTGLYAFINNPIVDMANALFDTDPSGNPFSALNGLLTLMNLSSGGNTAQSAGSPFTLTPEEDAILNGLRPKLGIACLLDDSIKIVNILGPMISDGIGDNASGTNIGDENLLNHFFLRDENGDKLTGATAMTLTGSDYLVAFGSTLRRFSEFGEAKIITDVFEKTLTFGATDSIARITSNIVEYLVGGELFRIVLSSGSNTAQPLTEITTPGKEVDPIIEAFNSRIQSIWQNLSSDFRFKTFATSAIKDLETQEFAGIERLVSNIAGGNPGLLKNGEVFNDSITAKLDTQEGFSDVIRISEPAILSRYTAEQGSTPFSSSSQSDIHLGLTGDTGKHFGKHSFSLGTITNITKTIRYFAEFTDLITMNVDIIPMPNGKGPYPQELIDFFLLEETFNIENKTSETDSIITNNSTVQNFFQQSVFFPPALGGVSKSRETAWFQQITIPYAFFDEDLPGKTIKGSVSVTPVMIRPTISIELFQLGTPKTLVFTFIGTEDFPSYTMNISIYNGPFPPTDSSAISSKGRLLISETFPGDRYFGIGHTVDPSVPKAHIEEQIQFNEGDIIDGKITVMGWMSPVSGFYIGPGDAIIKLEEVYMVNT